MPRRKAQMRREKEMRQTLGKKAARYCEFFQDFSYRKESPRQEGWVFVSFYLVVRIRFR